MSGHGAPTLSTDAAGLRVAVVADDPAMVRLLGEAATTDLHLFLEVDCGEHRSGTDPDGATLLAAADDADVDVELVVGAHEHLVGHLTPAADRHAGRR